MALTRSPNAAERRHERSLRRRATPRWVWSVPVVVYCLVVVFLPLVPNLIAFGLGLLLIRAVDRRPDVALAVLLVLMPFHLMVFSGLYKLGVPAEILKPAAQWKEGIILAVLVVAMRRASRDRHHADLVDKFALGFVALGTAYLLLPHLFVGNLVGGGLSFSTRLIGWRTDVMYIALFVAARHLRLDEVARKRVVRAFLVTVTIVAVGGFVEWAFQDWWNTLWLDWLGLPAYRVEVLHAIDNQVGLVEDYTTIGGHTLLRSGSILIYAFALGFYGCVGAAVLADRIVRGIARRLDYVALFLVCGAVLLTLIRSAVLGLFVVLVITVLRRPSRAANRTRASAARVQFALLVGAILIFAVPAAAGLHVVDRFLGKDDYSSNDAHRDSLNKGYGELLEHPLGNGLATAAGAGQRSAVEGVVISENQYLQVGTQLGILGLALWVGVLVATIVELGRRALRAPPGFDVGALLGPRTALLALAASGLFLQVYIDFSVAWSLWVLAGLGLGISDTWLQDESTHSPSSRSDRSTVGARA